MAGSKTKTKKEQRNKRGTHPNSLANLKPSPPGETHNPNGRPLGSKDRSTTARYWLSAEMDFKNPTTKLSEKMSVEDAMTLSMIGQVITKGNVAAYNSLKDEAYGKIPNVNQHTGADGEDLFKEITVRIVDGNSN